MPSITPIQPQSLSLLRTYNDRGARGPSVVVNGGEGIDATRSEKRGGRVSDLDSPVFAQRGGVERLDKLTERGFSDIADAVARQAYYSSAVEPGEVAESDALASEVIGAAYSVREASSQSAEEYTMLRSGGNPSYRGVMAMQAYEYAERSIFSTAAELRSLIVGIDTIV